MAEAPSTPRVRAHRERRSKGLRCVTILIADAEIKRLAERGYLEDAAGIDALSKALETFIADNLR
jgi:hypothetical protein